MRQTRTTYGITCAYREYEYAARVVRPNNIAFLHGPTARQIERQDTWSIAVDCSVTQVEAAVPLAGSATFLPPCLEAKAQRCPCHQTHCTWECLSPALPHSFAFHPSEFGRRTGGCLQPPAVGARRYAAVGSLFTGHLCSQLCLGAGWWICPWVDLPVPEEVFQRG
jgi:hypothetical protein